MECNQGAVKPEGFITIRPVGGLPPVVWGLATLRAYLMGFFSQHIVFGSL
jgi:hypothetical protein